VRLTQQVNAAILGLFVLGVMLVACLKKHQGTMHFGSASCLWRKACTGCTLRGMSWRVRGQPRGPGKRARRAAPEHWSARCGTVIARYQALRQRIAQELEQFERTVAAIQRHWEKARLSGPDQEEW